MKLKTKNLKLKTNVRGSFMVEAIVAITIILSGIMATYTLAIRGIALNRVVSERYVGTYLAAEGIEVVKNFIDRNVLARGAWNQGLADGSYEIGYNITNPARLGFQTSPTVVDDISNPPFDESQRSLRYDSATGLYNYNIGQPTNYRRTITIETLASGEELRVKSLVRWTGSGGSANLVDLEDHFFNWRKP